MTTSVSLTLWFYSFFFFNDTATTEIYTLSLHDALPIWATAVEGYPERIADILRDPERKVTDIPGIGKGLAQRSEEHTSELQSHVNLVCRLLLEKKKKKKKTKTTTNRKL